MKLSVEYTFFLMLKQCSDTTNFIDTRQAFGSPSLDPFLPWAFIFKTVVKAELDLSFAPRKL